MTDETVVNNFEKYWQPKKKKLLFFKRILFDIDKCF